MSNPEHKGFKPSEFLHSLSIEETFYPAPIKRVENPKPTLLQPGDLVNILVGSATNEVGLVVIERNGNYEDKEPYCDDEKIGVQVVQPMQGDEVFKSILVARGIISPGTTLERAIRWFDSPDQLELLYREEPDESPQTAKS